MDDTTLSKETDVSLGSMYLAKSVFLLFKALPVPVAMRRIVPGCRLIAAWVSDTAHRVKYQDGSLKGGLIALHNACVASPAACICVMPASLFSKILPLLVATT